MDTASVKPLSKKKTIIKAFLFLVFIVSAIVIFRFSPLKNELTMANLKSLIDSTGIWGPLVFIIIYAVGISLFLPATLFTAAGAILFGPLYGFICNIIGALIGASIAFFVGRYLGRDFAASLIGDRLTQYDDKIEKKGFATVLYLRLIFFPFTPMNFGCGLTKIKFKDYFFGTFFGMIAGGFILTFFFATISEVIISKDWQRLLSFKVFFSIGLFILSFFIPKITKALKAGKNSHVNN